MTTDNLSASNTVLTNTITFTRMPIGSINIQQDDVWLVLEPKDDITPLESVHISIMLAMMTVPRHYNWLGYINENKIERHWRKK